MYMHIAGDVRERERAALYLSLYVGVTEEHNAGCAGPQLAVTVVAVSSRVGELNPGTVSTWVNTCVMMMASKIITHGKVKLLQDRGVLKCDMS